MVGGARRPSRGGACEHLARLFNETVFVVGMTHVQTKEAVAANTDGHPAAHTERSATDHPDNR